MGAVRLWSFEVGGAGAGALREAGLQVHVSDLGSQADGDGEAGDRVGDFGEADVVAACLSRSDPGCVATIVAEIDGELIEGVGESVAQAFDEGFLAGPDAEEVAIEFVAAQGFQVFDLTGGKVAAGQGAVIDFAGEGFDVDSDGVFGGNGDDGDFAGVGDVEFQSGAIDQ